VSSPIRIKRLRPGDDTETYCGRCKAERGHQVVALNADGTPASVICRTCRNQHRYREKKEPSAPASARSAGRKAGAKAEPARDAPTGRVRPYSPQEAYSEGEWIEHTKFGQGKVVRAREGKIEVKFGSENRVLLHAG
jgi:hypothetical protein